MMTWDYVSQALPPKEGGWEVGTELVLASDACVSHRPIRRYINRNRCDRPTCHHSLLPLRTSPEASRKATTPPPFHLLLHSRRASQPKSVAQGARCGRRKSQLQRPWHGILSGGGETPSSSSFSSPGAPVMACASPQGGVALPPLRAGAGEPRPCRRGPSPHSRPAAATRPPSPPGRGPGGRYPSSSTS